MEVTELDTFFQKFKQLWHSGHSAHLDVDTHAGHAWVGLRVRLGQAPGPLQHQLPKTRTRDGPSRQRRRARRAEDRKRQAEEANEEIVEDIAANATAGATQAEEAEAPAASEQVAEEVADTINNDEAAVEEVDRNVVGKAAKPKSVFECELCDSSFKSSRGLRAHEGRAHKANKGSPIAQLDGQSEKLEDNQDTGSSDESSDDEEHACDVCDFVAKTFTDVQAHKKTKHLFSRVKKWTSK